MSDISYTNWGSMSDSALCKVIGAFVQSHRLQQNKTQNDVANDAGISRSTVSLIERGESVNLASLLQVLRVLDQLNIMNVFKIEKQISPLALAKIEKQNRQRASAQKGSAPSQTDW